jgi:purine-cytosine permease-like protein
MPDRRPRNRHAARSDGPESAGPSRHIAAFFDDPALRPVLIVLVAHVALAGAIVLLALVRTLSPFAGVALALLLFLTVDGVVRAQQRRRVASWAALLWALAAVTAILGDRLGLL